ncbi:unnamed protein product [Pleuronectes platessa]|uniref:Uncharacterized protein n=1 Tax=Pleuronectes platessa TaxID=8262 RepID=A0A9N7V261_PLEPL|nr:unnamed protein product [Pleuronectes platessa]
MVTEKSGETRLLADVTEQRLVSDRRRTDGFDPQWGSRTGCVSDRVWRIGSYDAPFEDVVITWAPVLC